MEKPALSKYIAFRKIRCHGHDYAVGDRPYSWRRIGVAIGVVAAVVALVVLIVMIVSGVFAAHA